MLELFQGYNKMYPDLILEILDYFDQSNSCEGKITNRSVLKFCEKKGVRTDNALIYNPIIINRICKKLCEENILEQIYIDSSLGLSNNYLFVDHNKSFSLQHREQNKHFYNSLVYGFEYIYDYYQEQVIPLICYDNNGDPVMGTGFNFYEGIVTAKHCITDVQHMIIKGYKSEDLIGKKIYISTNDGVDLAFIHTEKTDGPQIYVDTGKILDEVLVMGYPKIPAFLNFLATEKATISSTAESRQIPTTGMISAIGDEYLTKTKAMLITAKIRGGNSGGPVINRKGSVIGIACQSPCYQEGTGCYDDLGYGIAFPAEYIIDIIKTKQRVLEVKEDFFLDWEQ